MKKGLVICCIITALEFIAAILLYKYLPDMIPTHWGISGEVDGYSGKNMIFLMPSISFVITLGMYYMPRIDPKGESIKKSGNAYPAVMIMLNLVFAVILAVTLIVAFGRPVPMNVVMCVMLGILFVVMGIYMPNIKQNYFFGFKLPWTLESEQVWEKTHKFGGAVFVISGVLFLLGAIMPIPYNLIAPLAFILAGSIITSIYSYNEYRKINKH